MGRAWRSELARLPIAAFLVLVGLASFGLWRVLSDSTDLPYTSSASPPASARVTRDHTYSLAVPGGVRAMLARGVPTAGSSTQLIGLQCTWTSGATSGATSGLTANEALSVSAEDTSTKAENTVGHFVAPVGGRIHVECAGWGAMFIPDSDDRPADASGWALLVATIALTAGAALALSAIRMALERNRRSRPSDEDDEVEGFVDIAAVRGEDAEVGGGDRGDVVA